MPIQTYGGFKRMTEFCKTFVPQARERAAPTHPQTSKIISQALGIQLSVKLGNSKALTSEMEFSLTRHLIVS